MRNITFEEVGMINYGPYTEEMILTFVSNTLTLVTGPNGIGKTMAIDAIPFTFYGITSKGAKGDDVVNNQIGKNCKTWVKFKVNDDQYIVTRYHKYTKYGNTVIVNHNGVDIKQGHREVLPFIERLVCPQQTFMNSLMFGQKVKDFFTDLVDSKRKEIFRKILDLGMFLIYYKVADTRSKKVDSEIHDIRNRAMVLNSLLNEATANVISFKNQKNKFYDEKEKQIEILKQSIRDNNRMLDQWKKELTNIIEDDTDLETIVVELTNVVREIKDVKKEVISQIAELGNMGEMKITELRGKAEEARNKVAEKMYEESNKLLQKKSNIKETLSNVISDLQEEIHGLKIEKNKINNVIESLKERIKEINENILDNKVPECPLCEQVVDDHTTNILNSKILSYEDEIKNANKHKEDIHRAINEVNNQITKYKKTASDELKHVESEERGLNRAKQDKLESIKKRLDNAIVQITSKQGEERIRLTKDGENKTKELSSRKNDLLKSKIEIEERVEKVHKIEDTIKSLLHEESYMKKQILDLKESEYDDTNLKENMVKEEQRRKEHVLISKEIEKKESILDIIQFWKTGFSSTGIPSMLIDEAIPYMNERVGYYLDMLTNGRYVVSFDTLAETKSGEFRDKISVNVLDTETRADSRVQLSGGQTRIIDIAIILTLGDLLSKIQDVKFNILLFDEIFDALDEQNIQYVCKVLSKIKIGKALYIISHQYQDHLEADETLTFS